tara:strand:+ start:530 stop:694 length:165 start_codon:yes stop_codon:yes gene_type:complete
MKLKSPHTNVRNKLQDIAKKWRSLSEKQKLVFQKRAEDENAKLIAKDDLTNTLT